MEIDFAYSITSSDQAPPSDVHVARTFWSKRRFGSLSIRSRAVAGRNLFLRESPWKRNAFPSATRDSHFFHKMYEFLWPRRGVVIISIKPLRSQVRGLVVPQCVTGWQIP